MMLKLSGWLLLAAMLAVTPSAFSADSSSCVACHDVGEFSAMSASDISAAARDQSIPAHKSLNALSDAELTAIAAELAGSEADS